MRAQELSVTTIIIAALAIIVLIVISVLLMQNTTLFGKGLRNVSEQKCEPMGYKAPMGTNCDVIYGSFKDLGPNEICCAKRLNATRVQ